MNKTDKADKKEGKTGSLMAGSFLNDGKRPRPEVPISRLEIFGQFISVLGVIFTIIVFATLWKALPTGVELPIHFDFAGNPNGWGSKNSLIFLPILGLALAVMFTVLERFPHIYNFTVQITPENAVRQYGIGRTFMVFLKACMVWMFGGLFYLICRMAETSDTSAIGPFIGISIGVMTLIIVVFMVAMAKNK